jgi:murein DD-endopeptidase MepM/ murein hydrolase activator NlpD
VHRDFPFGRTTRIRTGVGAALVAPLLIAGFVMPSSSSADEDDLRDRRNQVERDIDQQQDDVHEISRELARAQARVDAVVADLVSARARLADLRVQVQAAVELDRQMQARLEAAIVRLQNARDDLAQGRQDVKDQRQELAEFAMATYQQGGLGTLNLGLGLDAATTQDAVDTFQGLDAVANRASVELQRLEAAEVILTLTEERVEETRDEVRESRIAAAENLALKQDLEAQAEVAAREVRAQAATLRAEQAKVRSAKQREVGRLNRMQAERDRIEDRLREIAARRARQHGGSLQAPANGGGFLSYPVNGTYITSPYGMRLHPILGVYKLHDGTDFHAPCGVPVYAAAAGRITSQYYNAGYGNRIIVDHGYVNGASLWTSYNHLTSFAQSAGSQVERGEVIGYAGTTGYSTGCHLHFMVYVNGGTVDPTSWL